MKRLLLLLAAGLIGCSGSPTAPKAINLTGNWQFEANFGYTLLQDTISITQTGTTFTEFYHGAVNSAGYVKGDSVYFSVGAYGIITDNDHMHGQYNDNTPWDASRLP